MMLQRFKMLLNAGGMASGTRKSVGSLDCLLCETLDFATARLFANTPGENQTWKPQGLVHCRFYVMFPPLFR